MLSFLLYLNKLIGKCYSEKTKVEYNDFYDRVANFKNSTVNKEFPANKNMGPKVLHI